MCPAASGRPLGCRSAPAFRCYFSRGDFSGSDLNYTNVYIFGVRSLRPDRSEDEVNPHHCALCWGLADILAHSKTLTRSCSMGFCSFTSCY